jgi:hypothetical protein
MDPGTLDWLDKALAKATKPVETHVSSEIRKKMNAGSDDSNVGVLLSSPSPSGKGDRPRPVQPSRCQTTALPDPSLPPNGPGIPGTTFIPLVQCKCRL